MRAVAWAAHKQDSGGEIYAVPDLPYAPDCLLRTQGMQYERYECQMHVIFAVQTPCQKYWPELLKMIQNGTLTPWKVCHPCMPWHVCSAL